MVPSHLTEETKMFRPRLTSKQLTLFY
uniref:Uncharacterized protein n=1 Tax=Arundo donax TaxID=35708 RepID=A0A0A8YY74_ARUDO